MTYDELANAVWLTAADGSIATARLLDGAVQRRGEGYVDPVVVVPLVDGLRVLVAERDGPVWVASRERPDRACALALVSLSGPIVAGDAAGTSVQLVVDRGDRADLVVVDPETAEATTLAADLPPVRAMAVDRGRGWTAVLLDPAAGDRAVGLVTDDGAMSTLALPGSGTVGKVVDVVTAPPGTDGVLVVDDAGGLHLLGTDGSVVSAPEPGPGPTSAASRWGSLVLLATDAGDIVGLEWGLDEGDLPMSLYPGLLATGGWARLRLDLAAFGRTLDEIEIVVLEGPEGGSVSAGREPQADDGTDGVILLAGPFPGEYRVQAVDRASGDVLGTRRFRVSAGWPDDEVGPPVVLTGPATLFNWGGTGATPNYTKGQKAPRTWKVAVVLVSTAEGDFTPTEVAALSTEWDQRLRGSGVSARTYYEEVSYYKAGSHGTTIELSGDRVLGPVALDLEVGPISVPLGWGTVFQQSTPGDPDDGWADLEDARPFLGLAVSRHLRREPDGARILGEANAVVLVVRTPTPDIPVPVGGGESLPTRYIHALQIPGIEYGRWNSTLGELEPVSIPTVLLPSAYPGYLVANPDLPFQYPETNTFDLCHELGHTLGLDDLYDGGFDIPAEIAPRLIGSGDLMAENSRGPHLSVANRMRLGWLPRNWVKVFDFRVLEEGGEVTLHAIEALTAAGPPAGQKAAIEIPIDDGWSYFFEYRRRQPGQTGDQHIVELDAEFHTPAHARLVLGTDVRVAPPGTKPRDELPFLGGVARPPILRLPLDVDVDGPVLETGENYRDSDVTNPLRMYDFVATATGVPGIGGADTATMTIDYVEANRPQLLIHPAPGRGNYRSDDIELMPAAPDVKPRVVKGAVNTVRVRVWNSGVLAADQVQIHVSWLPFTTTAGPANKLRDPDPFAVPRRDTPGQPAGPGYHDVFVPWTVPPSVIDPDTGREVDHFCVQVQIVNYKDPRAGTKEIVVDDNWAQSNFSTKWLAHGSPSERSRTVVTATNTRSRPTRYRFALHQNGELFRVYLDAAWRRLDTGETASIGLAYESLAGDPEHGAAFDEVAAEHVPVSTVSVSSWADPGPGIRCRTPRPHFGGTVTLYAGRRCWVSDVVLTPDGVRATFRCGSPGAPDPVDGGDARLVAWWSGASEDQWKSAAVIDEGGEAYLPLSRDLRTQVEIGEEVVCLVARVGDVRFAEVVSPVTRLFEG